MKTPQVCYRSRSRKWEIDKMPTNRPFFTNFFSAFRARSSPIFQAKSNGTTSAISPSSLVSSAHVSTTATNATSSSPRTITTKSSDPLQTQNTAKPATPLPFSPNPSSHRYVPPLSRSPATGSQGLHPNLSISPQGTATPLTRGRPRRGSDSSNSSGGFADALGPEKWYIGGRTAGGEETFYRLGLVGAGAGKRVRSLDRLSL